jgi:hypothetical protein
MIKRRQAVQVRQDQSFKGRQFTAEVILWALRWYLMFPISYRDLMLMLLDRGVEVDHDHIPLDPGLFGRIGEADPPGVGALGSLGNGRMPIPFWF